MHYQVLDINDPAQIKQIDSISRRLAEIVTSPYNDQATILINGNRGSGKSFLGLDIATKTSQEIAKIKGGNPSKYFTLENVAIIKLDRVLEVMENLTQYGIYFLDDIGVGYSAREWRSEKNIRMNKIIQTFRTDNVITLLSVPDKGLIDKVPREMVDKYIETNKGSNMYSQGLNIVKVFNIEKLLRDNKMLEILPVVEHQNKMHQYARYVTRRPPPEITHEYETQRKKIAQDLRREEIEAVKSGEVESPAKVTKTSQILQLRDDWNNNRDLVKDKYSWSEYLQENGLNPESANVRLSQLKNKKKIKQVN